MKKLFGAWALLLAAIAVIALATKEWIVAMSRVWKDQEEFKTGLQAETWRGRPSDC